MEKEFIKQIQTSKAICIDRTSNSRTMWYVFFEGNVYRVVYGKNTHDIITALHLASGKIPGLKLLFNQLEELRRNKKALLSRLNNVSQPVNQPPDSGQVEKELQEINLQIPAIIEQIKRYRY